MARVPRIDGPCPLGIDEQRRIQGYCSHCRKHVHALDGMVDAERLRLLQDADGPICVSYRRDARAVPARAVGLGIVVAASLAGGVAFADGVSTAAAEPTPLTAAALHRADPRVSPPAGSVGAGSVIEEVIWVGTVRDPSSAEWFDDHAHPDAPVRVARGDDEWQLGATPANAQGDG